LLGGWHGLLPPPVVALVAEAIVVLQGAQATAQGGRAPAWCSGWPTRWACWWRGRPVAGWRWRWSGSSGCHVLPATVVHFFAGTVGVPLLLLLARVVLLAVTLVLLRWQQSRARATPPTPAGGRPAEWSSPADSRVGRGRLDSLLPRLDRVVDWATKVDGDRRLGLVAIAADTGQLIAHAGLEHDPQRPDRAEFAVAVADRYQAAGWARSCSAGSSRRPSALGSCG
jgi:hypothetical protein